MYDRYTYIVKYYLPITDGILAAWDGGAGWRRPLPLTVCDLAERDVQFAFPIAMGAPCPAPAGHVPRLRERGRGEGIATRRHYPNLITFEPHLITFEPRGPEGTDHE